MKDRDWESGLLAPAPGQAVSFGHPIKQPSCPQQQRQRAQSRIYREVDQGAALVWRHLPVSLFRAAGLALRHRYKVPAGPRRLSWDSVRFSIVRRI